MCEGGNRRVTRMDASGNIAVVAERYEGKRLNRPNDIICKSDGSIYFTDPGYAYRLPNASVPIPASTVSSPTAPCCWWLTASIPTV